MTLDPAQPPLSLSELYGINGTLLTPGGKALSVDEGSEREPGCFWYEKRGKRLYILCKDVSYIKIFIYIYTHLSVYIYIPFYCGCMYTRYVLYLYSVSVYVCMYTSVASSCGM